MYAKCALMILLALTIESTHSVIADKGKFEAVKPSPIDELPDERRTTNFKESSGATDNKRHNSESLESEKTKDSRQEKKTRTILPGPSSTDSADKYEVSSSGRQESGQGIRATPETGRYPSRYGSRPEDRFGWQSYNPASPGRRGSSGSSSGSGSQSGGGLYESSYSGGNRYGTRPSYYGGDSDYDRPSSIGNRPGRPSYGYGGNAYSDSGAYGSNGYEVNRPVGGYGNRPPGSINFGGGRPGSGTYGGGHGVYGTIGEEDEFPGQEDVPDGGHPSHPGVNNLNTQKAVALKALAGVALIGAAAALATNPVLLPIGVLAGRRKRSVNYSLLTDDIDTSNLLKLLEDQAPKMYREKIKEEMLDSPTCVARLACEIQQEYSSERKNNDTHVESVTNVCKSLKKHLVNLIQRKLLHPGIRYKNIKKLIMSADAYDGKCNVFVCDFMKD